MFTLANLAYTACIEVENSLYNDYVHQRTSLSHVAWTYYGISKRKPIKKSTVYNDEHLSDGV